MRDRSTLGFRRIGGQRRAWVLALSLSAVLTGPTPARAASVLDVASAAFDLVIVRPLGVGRIAFGAALFLPVALFAEVPPGLGGETERWHSNVNEAWQIFVGDPVEATFMTPLGEFEENE